MKFARKIVGILLVLIVLILLIINNIRLEKLDERLPHTSTLTPILIDKIDADARHLSSQKQVVQYAAKLTSKLLSFQSVNDLPRGSANCVGYAQLYSDILNKAFSSANIDAEARPVVGYVKLFGLNLCNVLKALPLGDRYRLFVKDHDFVEIRSNGECLYVDALLYDYTYTTGMTKGYL